MITTLAQPEARSIASRMRACDRDEINAVHPYEDMAEWADRVFAMPGLAMMVVANDGDPVAMGGGLAMGHLAGVWFVSTPRIAEPLLRVEIHRMALVVHRRLRDIGVRRFMAVPKRGNLEACRWLHRMGYRHEGDHPGYGRGGETFSTWGLVYVN